MTVGHRIFDALTKAASSSALWLVWRPISTFTLAIVATERWKKMYRKGSLNLFPNLKILKDRRVSESALFVPQYLNLDLLLRLHVSS